jgi:hypothetical protein
MTQIYTFFIYKQPYLFFYKSLLNLLIINVIKIKQKILQTAISNPYIKIVCIHAFFSSIWTLQSSIHAFFAAIK